MEKRFKWFMVIVLFSIKFTISVDVESTVNIYKVDLCNITIINENVYNNISILTEKNQ